MIGLGLALGATRAPSVPDTRPIVLVGVGNSLTVGGDAGTNWVSMAEAWLTASGVDVTATTVDTGATRRPRTGARAS